MLGCYCDCPGIELPFTNDILSQQDLDMIYGNTEIPKTPSIQTEKINWYANWSTTEWSKDDLLNGGAIITDQQLKKDVWEWLHETIHPEYFQKIWNMAGRKTPPVSILCFSESSAWHREGPIQFPENLPQHINKDIVAGPRAPAVINFRLLGDPEGSSLEFAKPQDTLNNAEQECINKYFDTWTEDVNGELHATEHEGVVFTAAQHWLGETYNWQNNLTKITEHVGMHNPYIVNLSKWHRVLTNGEPRVTFRIHANTDLTFEDIERLQENGEFFK